MDTLRIFLSHASVGFRRQLVYRFANWSGLFTNAFFLFFRAYAFEACYAERHEIGGLGVAQVVTYVTVTQALLMVIPQWGRLGVAEAVRSGQIAVDLCRPVDYVGARMAERIGVSLYYLGVRTVPLLLLGGTTGLLHPPPDPLLLFPFLLSVLLAAWIANLILLGVEMSSFWLGSETGVRYLVLGLGNLFSGLILPLAFFPETAQVLSRWLPFESTLYTPTRIYLGETTEGLATALGLQAVWAVLLWIAASALFRAGSRELVVQGG